MVALLLIFLSPYYKTFHEIEQISNEDIGIRILLPNQPLCLWYLDLMMNGLTGHSFFSGSHCGSSLNKVHIMP